mgnify:CR=1 FL=1
MYKNLFFVMKEKKITFSQIADLLGYKKYQTVSDYVQGKTDAGFLLEDALKIWKVYFPEYSFEWLFAKTRTN